MARGKENTAHIGIYGGRNLGKSSLINVLTGYKRLPLKLEINKRLKV